MDLGTYSLLLVISVLGTNQLVMRLRALHEHASVFWTLEALNVAFGLYVLAWGLPGLRGELPVGLVVGLLVLLHAAQNFKVRQGQLLRMREEDREALRAERAEQIRESLRD